MTAVAVGLIVLASHAAGEPLSPAIPGSTLTVDSCADPAVIRGQTADDPYWYMYCTSDPLNDADRSEAGGFIFHRIPQLRSRDLAQWDYVGDAFPQGAAGLPPYAEADAALWAPDVVWSEADTGDGDGQYLLLFGVTDTVEALSGIADCAFDNAIGFATSESPAGPWTFADAPLVPPRPGGAGCDFKWTFDPDVLGDRTGPRSTLYYGSYYGGVFAAPLTLAGGARVDTEKAAMVAIDNRYEGATVVQREGWHYLFASSTDCCNGALTGYGAFVGRSRSPTGPFVDRQGNPMTAAAAGGTPFLAMTGDRWVGPGHNTLVLDEAGDWWTFYHAVDRTDPYFAGAIAPGERGFTRRPVQRAAVTWVDGWPTIPTSVHEAGAVVAAASDGFDADLGSGWTWETGSAAGPVPQHSVVGDVLRVAIQTGDTHVDANTANVLVHDAPDSDFIVEVRVRTSVPASGCCFNFAQAGLGLFGDEDNLVKLTETAIFNTRQTEWAKEVGANRAPAGWARYGNAVVGPPGVDWTYLRIAVERAEAGGGEDRFTAYTSQDGDTWLRGATWTHRLDRMRIALFAMGQQMPADGETNPTLVAEFDDLRTFRIGPAR